MSTDPRAYLRSRFTDDAATLRARAATLATGPAPRHGPDATASRAMADACDTVVTLLDELADANDIDTQLAALDALVPRLHALAERAPDALVRSVFVGAATRVHDVVTKERTSLDEDVASSDEVDESSDGAEWADDERSDG